MNQMNQMNLNNPNEEINFTNTINELYDFYTMNVIIMMKIAINKYENNISIYLLQSIYKFLAFKFICILMIIILI